MASESLAFSRREKLRFDRADTVLRFDKGIVTTDALELQGRDLRLFASGRLDLTDPAVADYFSCPSKCSFGTLLRTNLENGTILLAGIAEQAALCDRQRHWLLTVNILAVFDRR